MIKLLAAVFVASVVVGFVVAAIKAHRPPPPKDQGTK